MDAQLDTVIALAVLDMCVKLEHYCTFQSRDNYSQANLGNYLLVDLKHTPNSIHFGYGNYWSSYNYIENIALICLSLII